MITIYHGYYPGLLKPFKPIPPKIDTSKIIKIVEDVKSSGDEALNYYNKIFYGADTVISGLYVSRVDIREAYYEYPEDYIDAIDALIARVKSIERRVLSSLTTTETPSEGIQVVNIVKPLKSVGIVLPSSKHPTYLIMVAVPAIVAGVKNIIALVPPDHNGDIHPALKIIADRLGIMLYRVGIPHSIAALEYSTQSIPRVDKIVALYDPLVLETLRYIGLTDYIVLDRPRDLIILSDSTGDPEFIAWDMIAQMEYPYEARVILFTIGKALAEEVASIVNQLVYSSLLNREYIIKNLKYSAIVSISEWDDAIKAVNELSPEYVTVIAERDIQYRILNYINNVNVIMIGGYTPHAFIKYMSGVNYICPSGGESVVRGGLSVLDYVKLIRVVRVNPEAISYDLDRVKNILDLEGLANHYISLFKRLEYHR